PPLTFKELLRLRGRMAPSGARPSTGPEKRSAPRAGQRLAGAVARRWRPPARSLRGRDRRYSARVSLVSVEVMVLGAGERATRLFHAGEEIKARAIPINVNHLVLVSGL